jgi:hypothetical protein
MTRRDWKESADNWRDMKALWASCMSLYEISEIVPARASFGRGEA